MRLSIVSDWVSMMQNDPTITMLLWSYHSTEPFPTCFVCCQHFVIWQTQNEPFKKKSFNSFMVLLVYECSLIKTGGLLGMGIFILRSQKTKCWQHFLQQKGKKLLEKHGDGGIKYVLTCQYITVGYFYPNTVTTQVKNACIICIIRMTVDFCLLFS